MHRKGARNERRQEGHPAFEQGAVERTHGEADLIAIGREALRNPNWALHAEEALGLDNEYASWPVQAGWWLDKRKKAMAPSEQR